jgi:hypothetical protein
MMATPDASAWTLPRLRIDRDGAWLHEGEEVTHEGLLAGLRTNLKRDADGHFLEIGAVRVPVEVDDAPFVVLRAEPDGDRLMLTLNDRSRERLAPDTLRFGADGAPHCPVKEGRFEARWTRAATYQLLQHVRHDEDARTATLCVGERRDPLPGLPVD